MPKIIFRLLLTFFVFVGSFMLLQNFITPKSFGKNGHYRADAIQEIKKQIPIYKGEEACVSCHEDINELKSETVTIDDEEFTLHSNLRCETCHTPRIDSKTECKSNPPKMEPTRKTCGQCHSINASRKNKMKMIDLEDHKVEKNCIKCHNPHKPWTEE